METVRGRCDLPGRGHLDHSLDIFIICRTNLLPNSCRPGYRTSVLPWRWAKCFVVSKNWLGFRCQVSVAWSRDQDLIMLSALGCNVTHNCGKQEKIYTWFPAIFCGYDHWRSSCVCATLTTTAATVFVKYLQKSHPSDQHHVKCCHSDWRYIHRVLKKVLLRYWYWCWYRKCLFDTKSVGTFYSLLG